MDRRDMLKSLGVVAAAAARDLRRSAGAQPRAGTCAQGLLLPWDSPDPKVPGRQNMARVPDDYFIPDRFAGKTFIVTGSARGMGADAARRVAREGANVVGVDILEALGTEMHKVYAELIGRYGDKEGAVVDVRFNTGGLLHDQLIAFLTGER